MSELTKEWLLKTIAELEEERDAVPGAVNEDAAMSLAAMKLALASLEAESKLSNFVSSQVSLGGEFEKVLVENLHELYVGCDTAPPAPISVPDESAVELLATDLMKRIDKITGERHSVATLSSLRVSIVEACRAAMLQELQKSAGVSSNCRSNENVQGLQAGNSPGIPDGWVVVPVEPTEDMIVNGFESEPDESFSDEKEWELYEAMSGCQQAAHRAKSCWAAMISAAPKI